MTDTITDTAASVEIPTSYQPKALDPAIFGRFLEARKAELVKDAPPVALESEPIAPEEASAVPVAAQAQAFATPTPTAPSQESIAAAERMSLRAADLDRREAELRAREEKVRALDRGIGERFSEQPWDALTDVVRASLGDGATPDEVERELKYQIYLLNVKNTGFEVEQGNPSHELARLDRELRISRAQQRKLAEQSRAERESAAQAAKERERQEQIAVATQSVSREFAKVADNYPHLADAVGDPADLIVRYVLEEHGRTGRTVEIEDAMKFLDNHFEQLYRPLRERIAARNAALRPPQSQEPQRVPTARPRSLTNVDASESSRPEPITMDEYGRPSLDQEERLRRSHERWLRMMRGS